MVRPVTWDELDEKFPVMRARYETARARYVLRGTDPRALAAMLDLEPKELLRRAADERWDALRIEALRTSAVEARELIDRAVAEAPNDPLAQHLTAADAALQIGVDYLVALTSAETINDARLIQAKALSFKLIVEGIKLSIDTARLVRGIALGQPSRTAAQESKEVRFKIAWDDDEKETA